MRLSDLLQEIEHTTEQPGSDPEIAGLAHDSRGILPGFVFVACPGENSDGHDFIPQAVAAGAVAVVGERALASLPVPYIRVSSSRKALGRMAAAFYGHPSRQLVLIGVTGTDGKTTTVNLIHGILRAAGLQAGMISSVSAVIGERELDTGFHVTTPDASAIQEYLARMVQEGISHCVLEVTSHGLAQSRVAGCEFDFAVQTNITREHLDYHGDFESYRKAKSILFSGLNDGRRKTFAPPRKAILNADDPSCDFLRAAAPVPCVTYGITAPADVTGTEVRATADGLSLAAHLTGGMLQIKSSLLGDYNASNILAAITLAVEGLGLPAETAAYGVANLRGIPGRMERIHLGQGFTAIVDFAHTPNALLRALKTARQMAGGHVIVVFGSAGLRDREKRRRMAELAAEMADASILTAEDPRTEALDSILSEMAAGATAGGGLEGVDYWRIPDRGEAIRFAVRMAHPGDVIIACGKGHEQSMCFGEREYPWDDRTAMRAAICERLVIPGPAMPNLPTSLIPSSP
jgi:UDP-N-acetylmuramoyl-L-alanyl-D-glutamate--2,6-diaminopimelate ligase